MAVSETHKESDGRSVTVTLSHTTGGGMAAYVQQWLGITVGGGASGEQTALNIEGEYQFDVGATLDPSVGDIVYIDPTAISGTHVIPEAAYTTSAASNIPFFKCTSAKDANNIVTGILLQQV